MGLGRQHLQFVVDCDHMGLAVAAHIGAVLDKALPLL